MDSNVYADLFDGDALAPLTHRSPLIGSEPGSGKSVMAEVIAVHWALSETDETAPFGDVPPVGEVR